MLKRFAVYSLALLLVFSAVYLIYHRYTPEVIEITPEEITYNIPTAYNHNTIDSFIKEQPDGTVVFFYNVYDTNSIYVFNHLLTSILKSNGMTSLPNVVFCDLTNADTSTMLSSKNHWGFYQYPAFSNIKFKDNKMEISSSLEWSNSNIMTKSSVENWLINNGVIKQAETPQN